MSWLKSSSTPNGANGGRKAGYPLEDLKADIADKISGAIMMVDRDFNVTYVNGPTMELLKKNATAFRGLWPNFDPDKIVGTCIDTFHKNPAHQRKLLSDQSKLPLKTEITIGDLKVQLLVSASLDRRGNYVGNVLEWQDVTAIRMNAGMLDAINKAQAVIEFSLDGTIQDANENFLKAHGYTLDEIRGQHHSMFVEPAYRESPEYKLFWQKLGRGEFDAGQYKRIGKGGREVWIQASYNPIFDAERQAIQGREICDRYHPAEAAKRRLRGPDRGDQQGAGRDRVHARRQDPRRQREFSQNARLFARRGQRPAPRHLRRSGLSAEARNTRRSGRSSAAANSMPVNISASAKAAGNLDSGKLQPDHGLERQAVQSREIRNRHHCEHVKAARHCSKP